MIAQWFIPVLHFIAGFLCAMKKSLVSGMKVCTHQREQMVSQMHLSLYRLHCVPVRFVSAHRGMRAGHRVLSSESSAGHSVWPAYKKAE